MIVKNEAHIIERCLLSVYSHIDTFVICDTGSTDNTVEKVEGFFSERGIQGSVYRDEWVNFASNRNLCLQRASSLDGLDFCLMVDADETLVVHESKWRDALCPGTVYSIATGTTNFVYYVPVLTPASLRVRYVGVTHEYLDIPDGSKFEKFDDVRLFHFGDGGSRGDKLARDRDLIERAMAHEQDVGLVGRYIFYLAQTYFDMGQYEKAMYYYKRRADRGGWAEEVFYALYMRASCLLHQNNMVCDDRNVRWFLKAWQFRPTRLEPLYMIMKYCGDKKLAVALGSLGIPVKMTDDLLFVEKQIYTYEYDKLFRTLSVCK